ncbi:MAG: sigma 54-interacting transcriptional regulator [Oceanidesulfovibrio sp.]
MPSKPSRRTLHETAFESCGARLLVRRLDGRILDASRPALELWGMTRHDMLSSTMDALGLELPPFFPSGREMALQLRLPGQAVRHVELEATPMEHEGVDIVQLIIRDMSPKRRAEETLRQAALEIDRQRQSLETILDTIPDAVISTDTSMRVTTLNAPARKMCLECTMEPGSDINTLAQQYDCPLHEPLRQALTSNRPVEDYRLTLECGDGRKQVVLCNVRQLRDDTAGVLGVVLVLRDISRLVDIERQLDHQMGFGAIVGKSELMRSIFSRIEQYADVDATVLITGESGTGKDLIAEAIHATGPRSKGPLVKLNCAALSENLLESELFGHVRGAFTGAVSDKAGRIQAAEGGTLFLDEIGDISPHTQLRLLRFLESKEYERVGESSTRKADVRIIAATNANLTQAIREGRFRADLYYRLRVMVLHVPPLKDRSEDIPLLIDTFIRRFNSAHGKEVGGVTGEVLQLLLRYHWPGNVRELKHTIEHAFVVGGGSLIEHTHLPAELQDYATRSRGQAVRRRRKDISAEDILRALEQTGWKKAPAARILGVGRTTLYMKMESLGIQDRRGGNRA